MPDQRVRYARIENDRHAPRLDLARIETPHCTLARDAPDLVRRFEVTRVQRGGEIVVALHAGALARDRHHRDRVARARIGAAKAVARDQHHAADAG